MVNFSPLQEIITRPSDLQTNHHTDIREGALPIMNSFFAQEKYGREGGGFDLDDLDEADFDGLNLDSDDYSDDDDDGDDSDR